MPELYDYEPIDLAKIEPNLQDGVAKTLVSLGGLKQFQDVVLACGPAWTAIHDDEPIAIGGIMDSEEGISEGWLLTTPEVKKHLRWFLAQVKGMLSAIENAGECRAVVASVEVGFEAGRRFVKKLGFEYERDVVIAIGDGVRAERWVKWLSQER